MRSRLGNSAGALILLNFLSTETSLCPATPQSEGEQLILLLSVDIMSRAVRTREFNAMTLVSVRFLGAATLEGGTMVVVTCNSGELGEAGGPYGLGVDVGIMSLGRSTAAALGCATGAEGFVCRETPNGRLRRGRCAGAGGASAFETTMVGVVGVDSWRKKVGRR